MTSHGKTKDRAREVRGTKNGLGSGEGHTISQGRPGDSGGEPEYLCGRVAREVGAWGGGPNSLFGGIVAQLISQVEDQLSEARECIALYQRAEEKYEKQLENLRQLQQLADQEAQDD
ncbi:MAG: hypothetical protein ACHWZW_12005 [Spirulina sp.]